LKTSHSEFFLSRWGKFLYGFPYLLMPLAPLFWSGNFILGRAVRASLPPIGLAFWRWFVASLLLVSFAWPHLRQDWKTIIHHWKIVLFLSALGIAAFNTLVYTGLRSTTAINGILLQSALPIAIVAISYLFFRDTITPLQGLGVLVSLSGAITIIIRGSLHVLAELSLNTGDVLIFIAVICYAAYSVFLRKRPALHPLSFLTATFITGTIILLPLYLWEHFTREAMPVDRLTCIAVGYVAIFPSILAYLCFNRGVELLGANRAGLFIHLMPVFGSIMAIVFLGERFKAFHGVGIVLILSGIVLATRPARGH